MEILQDRRVAGQKLAAELTRYADSDPIVLGMPRGGVVVAYEIARSLKAPLDIIVTRKIASPISPEYAIGAIAPGDIAVFNNQAIAAMGVSATVTNLVAQEKEEIARRIKAYRGKRAPLELESRVVIIADDGVATGQTALVAMRAVRKMQPQKIVFACGVCAADSLTMLQQEADEVVCLGVPTNFYAVGQWYRDFSQTTNEEVVQLLGLAEK
jgi:putative phosphoribosyl transferase